MERKVIDFCLMAQLPMIVATPVKTLMGHYNTGADGGLLSLGQSTWFLDAHKGWHGA